MDLFLVAIILIILIPTAYAAIIGAPLAITSRKRIKEIIKSADPKPGDLIYDLGSGTGKIVLAFSENPNIKVCGFELSPVFYFLSQLKIFLAKRKNAKIYLKNFYDADFSKANIIYFYLIPQTLSRIKEKLEKECEPNTKIISFAFSIPEWEPYKIIEGDKMPSVYFYKKAPAYKSTGDSN